MKRLTRDKVVPCLQRYQVFEPVLEIDPGETIVVETTNHMKPVVESEADLCRHDDPRYIEREETGPIYVRGARPGDMLAVRIHDVRPVGLPHACAAGPCADEFPARPEAYPIIDGRVRLPGGASTPLAPMVGDIYTTPATPQREWWDHDHGGNMDFTEIRPGNTLYLPVFHDGALLVLGDCHAAQGDGEVFGEGAETAADVTITVDIDRTLNHPRPLVETPAARIGLASRGPLHASLTLAVRDMTALVARLYGLSEDDAYRICCLTGSVRMAGCLARRRWVEQVALVGFSVPKDLGL